MRQRSIVVVEDEANILEVIAYNLKREGYAVTTASNGEEGLVLIKRGQPDAVLLDIMLPGLDGIEVCRRLKADPQLRDIPVIMVTAKSEESDVVLGLGIGADDYIAKPFSTRELVARVKAALRRGPLRESQELKGRIELGGLVIDALRHEVTVDGSPVELTPTEFRLLHTLAAAPGRTFIREELLNICGQAEALVLERSVDAHVKALRKKLGESRGMVETVRGVGYRLRDRQGVP